MAVVLNEESINSQFNRDSFSKYAKDEIVPILQRLESLDIALLKNYNVYSKKVTADATLADLLRIQGDPAIDLIRVYLAQMQRAPYWNDDIRTDGNTIYITPISEIPNCITEAYERNGMVFSLDTSIGQRYYQISVNGKPANVPVFAIKKELEDHLVNLKVIVRWDSNSFQVEAIGYKFEVRFNEGHHNYAHFHLSNADEELSIKIPDADIIEGETLNKRKIQSWALNNMDHIVDLWNRYHPELPIVL